jgi:hypothetical protein
MRAPASRPFHALSIDWMQATGRPDGADGESARARPTAASYAQFTRKKSMSCLPLCTGFVYRRQGDQLSTGIEHRWWKRSGTREG